VIDAPSQRSARADGTDSTHIQLRDLRADAPYRSGKRPEWIKTKCPAWRAANKDRFERMQ